jgi:hypothetical protein
VFAALLISVAEWLAIGTFIVSTYTVVVQPVLRRPVVTTMKAVKHVVVKPVKPVKQLAKKIAGK